jgi:hypothetical protein
VATVEYKKNCDLCGLPVEIEGFSLVTGKGLLTFCCAGCQGIYGLIYVNNRILATDGGIDDTKTTNNTNEDN